MINYQCCLLSETLLIIMGLNFREDLKSQNHILDTFMHSIKKVMTYFNVLAEAKSKARKLKAVIVLNIHVHVVT